MGINLRELLRDGFEVYDEGVKLDPGENGHLGIDSAGRVWFRASDTNGELQPLLEVIGDEIEIFPKNIG